MTHQSLYDTIQIGIDSYHEFQIKLLFWADSEMLPQLKGAEKLTKMLKKTSFRYVSKMLFEGIFKQNTPKDTKHEKLQKYSLDGAVYFIFR